MQQLPLFKNNDLKFHGGNINKGQRKIRRPLSSRHPIHLVLKANKQLNLFEEFEQIKYLINKYSWKFHIKVYDLSIQKDHIHLLIKIEERESYMKFNRSLCGVLARQYGKGIWKLTPFTRVMSWGKDFQAVKKYIQKNEDEIWGVKPYEKRPDRYSRYF